MGGKEGDQRQSFSWWLRRRGKEPGLMTKAEREGGEGCEGNDGGEVYAVTRVARFQECGARSQPMPAAKAVKQIRPHYIRGVPVIPRARVYARLTPPAGGKVSRSKVDLVTDTNGGNALCT